MTDGKIFVKVIRSDKNIDTILIQINEKPFNLHLKPHSIINRKICDIRNEDIYNEVNPQARNLEGLFDILNIRSGNIYNPTARDEMVSIVEFVLPEGYTLKDGQ